MARPGDEKQHFFDGSAIPSAGETLTATGKVKIRTGPIRFDKKLGWVNQQTTGIIESGQKIDVLEVQNIADGFIWVRFSATGSAAPATGTTFHVVVGSFSAAGNAANFASSLRDKGYDSEIYKSTTGFYGVTIGKADRASAEALRDKAVADGTAPGDTYLHDGSRFISKIEY